MEYNDYLHECYQEERRIAIEEADTKKEFKKLLKGLTNITGLFRWLDEDHDWWLPLDIVSIENTGERMGGYPDYETCRIKDDEERKLYLHHSIDGIRSVSHYYVWQTGYDDSYSGYLLLPLKDGRYLKVNYNC